jgi:hypothetical protein
MNNGRQALGGGAIHGGLVLPHNAPASWTSVVHGIASGMRRYLPIAVCLVLVFAIFWTTRFTFIPCEFRSGQSNIPIIVKVNRWTGAISYATPFSLYWSDKAFPVPK